MAIQKGGVAKTTSSVAMSAALAELGYKVLLIDNDPQANSTRAVGRFGEIRNVLWDMIDISSTIEKYLVTEKDEDGEDIEVEKNLL